MTRPAALLLALALAAPAPAATVRVNLRCTDGSLTLTTTPADPAPPEVAAWARRDDGTLERWGSRDGFDGELEVRREAGALTLFARRATFQNFEVVESCLTCAPGLCRFRVIIRTPVNEPDVQVFLPDAPDLTRLVLRSPEWLPDLRALLTAIDPDCRLTLDPFAVAQCRPYVAPPGIAARVAAAVTRLDNADWRERRRAAADLADDEACLYLVRGLDRERLSPEAARGVAEILSRRPVLTARDRESLAALTLADN